MPNKLVEDIQCGLFGPCNAGNLKLCWLTRVILHNLIVLVNASKWWGYIVCISWNKSLLLGPTMAMECMFFGPSGPEI